MVALIIRQAVRDDIDWIYEAFSTWHPRPRQRFEQLFAEQDQQAMIIFVASIDGNYCGHVRIGWHSHYPHFRDNNIPEIQDLNVMPAYRRQGIASTLVDTCERRIAARAKIAGIGVGLYADYGAAQRMYILRGYVPDGHGIFYGSQPVTPGEAYRVDDDLVLYLVKHLA